MDKRQLIEYFILSNDDKHYIGGKEKGEDIPKTSNKKEATTFIWNKDKTVSLYLVIKLH